MGDSKFEVENSVNDVPSILEEKVNVSDKIIQIDSRITVSSKRTNEERLVLLAIEKAEDQTSDESRDQRRGPESLQTKKELGRHSQLVETRCNRSLVISETSRARRVLCLKVKALKQPEELQARLEKLKREVIQRQIPDLHEELARKSRIAVKEREIAEAASSGGTNFRSISPLDSFTEASVWMDISDTAENGAKSNIALSVHLTPENAVKLVHERKLSAPMRDSNPLQISTISTEPAGQDGRKDRKKAEHGACRQAATS